jgi:hypothetical protein
MTTSNRIHMDTSGFGFRMGAIYAIDRGDHLDWYWYVGSEFVRGPYSSKAKAVASRNRYLRSLDKKQGN